MLNPFRTAGMVVVFIGAVLIANGSEPHSRPEKKSVNDKVHPPLLPADRLMTTAKRMHLLFFLLPFPLVAERLDLIGELAEILVRSVPVGPYDGKQPLRHVLESTVSGRCPGCS